MFDNISLRFWHGGKLTIVGNGQLIYMGEEGRTFTVDPNELCYFDLVELAKKSEQYNKIKGLYFLALGRTLVNGLRKIVRR